MEESKALEVAMAQLERQFGAGSVMKLGSSEVKPWPAVPTGAMTLDNILGIGGLPRGRIVEIYGPESSGKSTIALTVVTEAQKMGLKCAYIDAEHALDPVYMQALGVNLDELIFSQPDYGEQALDIVETIARSGAIDLIVIDSVAALTPKSEIEGEMSDQNVGVQARLMSKALRKLTGVISKMNCTVIFINQIRMKIGMMGYGSPETTTGGNALKFYASVRIDVRRIASLKQGEAQIGNRVKAKVIKNKVAPPFRQAEFDIMFGEGISKEGELVDYGVKLDIIDKAGAWFSYEDTKLGQGRENVKQKFKDDPVLAKEIEEKIKNAMGMSDVMIMDSVDIEEADTDLDE